MPKINITAEAEQVIRANAELPFKSTGTQRPDGTWDIPLADNTLERLRAAQLAGESISDTIIRVCGTKGGLN